MEIVDVENHTPEVAASALIKLTFAITGIITPFVFPFSNESLTKPMLEFIDGNGQL